MGGTVSRIGMAMTGRQPATIDNSTTDKATTLGGGNDGTMADGQSAQDAGTLLTRGKKKPSNRVVTG